MRTAVVTGGTRGIGKATAAAFLGLGYRTAICGRDEKNLGMAVKDLGRISHDIYSFRCDVSDTGDVKKFSSGAARKLGKVDVLVNNAGVAYYRNLAVSTEGEINSTIDTNVRGLIMTTKLMLPHMSRDGIIINVSSGAGKRGYAGLAVYCASKFAVLGFTESLAMEIKQKVVVVCPGGVDTDMYRGMFGERPALKAEHIASQIMDICEHPGKFRSGSAVEVYNVTGELNALRKKYFGARLP